jgi:hypothetical protein
VNHLLFLSTNLFNERLPYLLLFIPGFGFWPSIRKQINQNFSLTMNVFSPYSSFRTFNPSFSFGVAKVPILFSLCKFFLKLSENILPLSHSSSSTFVKKQDGKDTKSFSFHQLFFDGLLINRAYEHFSL